MVTWKEFTIAAPDLAAVGKRLLYQYKVGYAFLATIRKDGGPRLHPVCPAISNDRLCIFVERQTPKYLDLLRDGRFALHTFPPEERDEEFYCNGSAKPVSDPEIRAGVIATYHRHPRDTEVLFELDIEHILHTFWENWPKPGMRPVRTKWHAPGVT
jgi:hypothetical protein